MMLVRKGLIASLLCAGIATATFSASRDTFGVVASTGENNLLLQPTKSGSVEASLAQVLRLESDRLLKELLPRATTLSCKERIETTAAHVRRRFERSFPRHAFAEAHCPVDSVASSDSASQADWAKRLVKLAPQLLDAEGRRRCRATIAFVVQLTHSTNIGQLERMLKRILRPNHLYHFSIDPFPNPPATDPSTGLPSTAVDVLKSKIHEIVGAHGPVRYLHISNATVDVVYTGQSLLHSHILALRDLLRPSAPHWDFVINLSASDYPIRSVDFMERFLAYRGAISWTESFLQIPKYSNGRALRSWFIECAEEPCAPVSPSVLSGEVGAGRGEVSSQGRLKSASTQAEATAKRSAKEHQYWGMFGRNALPGYGSDSDAGDTADMPISADPNCSGYVFFHHSSRKPPMAQSREFGGSAFWTLHRDFVRYVWGCLAVGSERSHWGAEIPEHHQSVDGLRSFEADTEYCESVRGMYKWFSSSFSPEETFLQTALFNGPFCNAIGGGNIRWVAWNAGEQTCNGDQRGGDYKSKRPGCLTADIGKNAWSPPRMCARRDGGSAKCSNMYHQLFARKFSSATPAHVEAMDIADLAADRWDWALREGNGLFPCVGETVGGESVAKRSEREL